MDFPLGIQFGSHKILLHTIFESIAYFVGFRYFLYLRKKQGDTIETSNRIWILLACIFGSLVGSRLLGGLEDVSALQLAPNKLLYFYQNKTVLGGLLGGLVLVEIVKKIIGEKRSSGDLITFPFVLALIIGRVGCFTMGVYEETIGTPTSLPWGIDLGDQIERHPVCFYEIIILILLWLGLVQLEKRYILGDGARFKIFMITYLLFRFLLDFIKPHYTFTIGLSALQIGALSGLFYYGYEIIHPMKLVEGARWKKSYSSTEDERIATQR